MAYSAFTALGVSADDVMTPVQIAMTASLPYTALRDAVLTHPTLVEGLMPLFSSQRALILQALRATRGMIGGPKGAAAKLGLKRTTLIAKMKKLGIYGSRHQRYTDEFNRAAQNEPSFKPQADDDEFS